VTTALSIRNLRKTYANGFQALKGIDLEVEQGEFVALLGPNGAGKSTTIGIINSLVTKTAGQVEVEEIVVNQAGYYGVPRREAFERAGAVLEQLGLLDKRRVTPRELSGGMKRRLMIARALVHRPRLLILDEPTAGVDIEIRRSMWEFLTRINQEGTTVILTTHYLEEAEALCEKVAFINHGRIVERGLVRDLIDKLEVETFVLNTRQPLCEPPPLGGEYPTRLIDAHTLEVAISRAHSVNTLFERLSSLGIQVSSMRNKANRLEELFLRLMDGSRNE